MPNTPSGDILKALGLPAEPKEGIKNFLVETGLEFVDPDDHGEDYPFKLQLRRIGTGSLEEFEGTLAHLPDLSAHGLELTVVAQILKADRTLSKILLGRPIDRDQVQPDPTKMINRRVWVQFPITGVEVCCLPKPVVVKIDRKVDADAEKRCGNCRLWDKRTAYEEYTQVTDPDAMFGGDRQMWKDIADTEARSRKLRRLDPDRIGLCLNTDTIYDQDMEACDEWEEE